MTTRLELEPTQEEADSGQAALDLQTGRFTPGRAATGRGRRAATGSSPSPLDGQLQHASTSSLDRMERIVGMAGEEEDGPAATAGAPDPRRWQWRSCCCCCYELLKKTDLGLGVEGDAAPRSKIDAPRGSAAVERRVVAGFKKPGAVIPCHE